MRIELQFTKKNLIARLTQFISCGLSIARPHQIHISRTPQDEIMIALVIVFAIAHEIARYVYKLAT